MFSALKEAFSLGGLMCDKCLALTLEALTELEEIKRILGLGESAGSGGLEASSGSSRAAEPAPQARPRASSARGMEAPRGKSAEG